MENATENAMEPMQQVENEEPIYHTQNFKYFYR